MCGSDPRRCQGQRQLIRVGPRTTESAILGRSRGAGIDANLPGDCLIDSLRSALADRSGSITGPVVGDDGSTVELLSPERVTFAGRTEELALAWCLVFLMGERGEIETVSVRR